MLTALLLIDRLRPAAPTALLALSSLPYAIAATSVGVLTAFVPKSLFVRIDNAMYSTYQRLVLFVFENFSGVKLSLYGDVEECLDKPESILFICNHQCTVDWVVADMLAIRQGTLGALRYVLKDTLQYVPLFGWYFYQRGCMYVNRHGFDESLTVRELQYLKNMALPFWLVLFPEGTRYSRKKPAAIEKSQQFAESRHLQVLENVLTPKARGLLIAINQLRSSLDAIYDVTIAYEQTRMTGRRGIAPNMFEFCCGTTARKRLHLHVERIPIAAVPTDDAGVRQWLHQRFVKKDDLMEQFYKSPPDSAAFPALVVEESCLPISSTICSLVLFSASLLPPILSARWRKYYAIGYAAGSVGLLVWLKIRRH
uniref:Phospholipid/glycerol acyltransferase domain-containing protein n=1 Tax=Plectus sambesii TaxID=2011161 RepID=A0A914WWA1_9BILA